MTFAEVLDPPQDGRVLGEQHGQGGIRKIIHIDADAFYASVEQRDNPELRGKPVAVGGSRARGVVAAASYEARRFGVHSAMPSVTAQRKCPDLIFVKPRFDVYRAVSLQMREIFYDYTPLVEPLSLDEAYLDVTHDLKVIGIATQIAEEIRAKIYERTHLTVSAGVSYCKFLAKMASDQNKPNGMFVIPPGRGEAFVAGLAVKKFHGIGPATAARLNALGIETGADLKTKSLAFLEEHFGKAGESYYWIARGIDNRPVRPNRVRKSVGAENTFERDLTALEDLQAELVPIVRKVWDHCEAHGTRGRTVTLKVKYADFEQITRSRSGVNVVSSLEELKGIAQGLLQGILPARMGIRLLGVTLSGLNHGDPDEIQMRLDL